MLAVCLVHATAPPTSICASWMGLPCSLTMISANSPACCSIASAIWLMYPSRCAWVSALHFGYAALALSTALLS
ncbi:hypothetical protein VMA_002084 [Vibrio mimicus VM223]|nr:hypothetical protein VMA_002084 [Vibrio mimicus VM223]